MTADNGSGRLFLRSVRIDGYKCFSGFELPFGELTLLLGKNGCGKTTVFEVINALSQFLCRRARIGDLFPFWSAPTKLGERSDNPKHSFELRASNESGAGEFCYRLTVEHKIAGQFIRGEHTRVASETLILDGDPLFTFENGSVHYSKGAGIPFDYNVSGLTHIGLHNGDHNIQRFYAWLNGITLLSLVPDRMESGSDADAQRPNADGSNFASWYRWAEKQRWMEGQNDGGIPEADEALRRVLPGYCRMEFLRTDSKGHRELWVIFASKNGKKQGYIFDALSAGQRVLIALYYFLHGGGRNRLLLLDEPDNFITLPEVQPLLLDIAEEAGDELPQVAMISHHPKAVDSISPEDTVWMDREAEQPARIVKFENDTKLYTSQLFAQGMAP